jgi:hypothetical protein
MTNMDRSAFDDSHGSLNEKTSNYDESSDTHLHKDRSLNEAKKNELRQITDLAQKETRNLWLWKLALLGLMLLTASLVSAGTYLFINNAQEADFEQSVRSY